MPTASVITKLKLSTPFSRAALVARSATIMSATQVPDRLCVSAQGAMVDHAFGWETPRAAAL
jgi:hypothetical protein